MSKIAQAEYKAKARFQALLRRRRCSRRRLKDRLFLNRTAKLGRNNNMVKGITIKNPSLSGDNEGNEEE